MEDNSRKIKELLNVELSKPVPSYDGAAVRCLIWQLPDGRTHRKYGNAIEYFDQNGKIKEDYQQFYLNGERHREDGPAIIFPYGACYYYLEGLELSKEEWLEELAKRNSSSL